MSLCASLIGFVAYFYVLQRVAASTMSLIMLITPVIAIILGYEFNHETINPHLVLGSSFILFALFLYFFGHLAAIGYRVNTLK